MSEEIFGTYAITYSRNRKCGGIENRLYVMIDTVCCCRIA